MGIHTSFQGADPLPRREGYGRRNLDLFLHGSKKHPVCFYFEDEGAEELYIRFLRKVFPKHANPMVLCTGGKTKKEVLEDAAAHKISPVVFVQDKDFDDLIGNLSDDPRVVCLNRYSFENYLFDPTAFVEIVVESKRRVRREAIVDKLRLDEYFSKLYESAVPLTKLYLIARKFNLRRIKTTKQSIYEIVRGECFLIEDADLTEFKKEVAEKALKSQKIACFEDIDDLMMSAIEPKPEYVGFSDVHPNAHLCGKQLLELSLSYVDDKVGLKLSDLDRYEVVMRLVAQVSVSVFDRVRDSILVSLRRQGLDQTALGEFS